MKKLLLPLLLAAFVLGPAARSEANLITNGGFETTPAELPGSGWTIYSNIDGWSSGAGPGIEIGLGGIYGVMGFEGSNVLELDSTANATVSQGVLVPTDGTYQLSFLAALRSSVAQDSGTFDVLWNNVLLASFSPTTAAMTLYKISVIASGGANTLSFVGTGTSDSYGAIVDNVQMLASVPDGGLTVALLGLTLAGVGLVRRRMAR